MSDGRKVDPKEVIAYLQSQKKQCNTAPISLDNNASNNNVLDNNVNNKGACKQITGVTTPPQATTPGVSEGEVLIQQTLTDMMGVLQNTLDEIKTQRTATVTGASGIEGEGQWYVTGEVPVQVATPNPPIGVVLDPEQIAFDTLTNTFGPSATGYQRERIRDALKTRNAPRATVINDGTTTIQVISTVNGRKWSPETPILPYEARTFFNVWELRIRCTVAGDQAAFEATGALKGGWYRVTEYDYWLSYSRIVTIGPPNVTINFTPLEIPGGTLTSSPQPLANTPIFGAPLSPINTPTTFRVEVSMSNAGVLSAIINGISVSLNNGTLLNPGSLYVFDVLLNPGDTVNFSYSNTGGTINIFRVQEIDSANA